MRLASIHIDNLRSFKKVTVPLDRYTRLVGPNGAGKSTVLCALNIFFRSVENSSTDVTRLSEEDFHVRDTSEPIRIRVTLEGLSDEAKADFQDYVRQDKLIITAEAKFDPQRGYAEVKQFGERLGMRMFAEFFEKLGDGAKVPELLDIYQGLRATCSDLPAVRTKDAMVDALHQYEAEHPEACELIPSEDQFYGVTKGANRLARYLQWVYVPAVKDTAGEQYEAKGSALSKLLARAVDAKTAVTIQVEELRRRAQEEYRNLLGQNQAALDGITAGLQRKLADWAHPDATVRVAWRDEPEKTVKFDEPSARVLAGESGFEGELARFGHGLQRSYLLALLHEIADSADENAPALILGCEEPELFQHPPQARHLSMVLARLAERGQVLITTHSPLFVTGEEFANVRYVRKERDKPSSVSWATFEELAADFQHHTGQPMRRAVGAMAKVHQALVPHLSEMFFTRRLVLVEGLEDIAYIGAFLALADLEEAVRAKGIHFVPVNGKSELIQPLLVASRLQIPTFAVFDSDADKPDRNGSRVKHEADNRAILSITGHAGQDPFPAATVWENNLVMWHSDIGATTEAEVGADWELYSRQADAQFGHIANMKKNTLHIGVRMALAWEAGHRFPSLQKLADFLVA